jgi:hypothetical protein
VRVSNLHELRVFRHDDFGFRLHRAQGFVAGWVLRLLAVEADNFLEVAGKRDEFRRRTVPRLFAFPRRTCKWGWIWFS